MKIVTGQDYAGQIVHATEDTNYTACRWATSPDDIATIVDHGFSVRADTLASDYLPNIVTELP